MASKSKQPVQRVYSENKTFSYSKANVNLSFTLRVDVKTELTDFLDLLAEAQKDVFSEIETWKENHK